MSDLVTNDTSSEQKRRVRRNAWLLALLAIAIYVAFILSGVLDARR